MKPRHQLILFCRGFNRTVVIPYTTMNDLHLVSSPASASSRITSIGDGARHADIAHRVRLQQAALLEIMKGGVMTEPLSTVFSHLTRTAARTLGVDRVSIWRFTAGATAMVLADLYDRSTGVHSSCLQLEASRYPDYFEALKCNRVIAATDVGLDPRTREFKDDYLAPLRILSMLDAAIWYGGESHGVVCIESVDERREWMPDEQQFAGSIADLVVMAIENEDRRAAQSELTASEERFSRIFRLNPDWMVITRLADGIVLDVNGSFERQSGYLASEAVGRTTRDLGLWAIPAQRDDWLAHSHSDGQVRCMGADLRMKSGDIRTFQISTESIIIDGEACLISISRDLSESKRQERLVFDIAQGVAAATGEFFFRSLVERLLQALDADTAFVGELAKDDTSRIQTIAVQNRAGVGNNFSYSLEGSPCSNILDLGVCAYPRGVAELFPLDTALSEKGIQGYVGAPLADSKGHSLGLLAVLFKRPIEQSEIAVQLLRIFAARASAELERRRQLDELEYRASHDQLTGLKNRAALERDLAAMIDAGTGGPQSALLMVDLDRFKELNDTLGHAVGDTLLQKIALRLTSENDVGSLCKGTVARLGGDEFAILLPGIGGSEAAERIASRTLAAITAPFDIEGYRLEVGASIGIAMHPQHGGNVSDLLRCADIAMYVAKRQGTGYAQYQMSGDPYSPKRLALLSQLRSAIAGGQLELHYQPRINLARGKPSGFEALVRWQHPQLGLLPPAQFIPLAELSDVIRPLTLWVLDEALAQLAAWTAGSPSLQMAVNLSARHLMDDACPDQVRHLLDKHAIDPARLELEITESAIIADPERATHTLKRIHDMGVHISIDDFGTGFSSLSHLKRLPLNALKIDISFVTHMLQNDKDAAIVTSIIALAHSLGLSVVAEGIEDEATRLRLEELGCDEGQGYLLGRPMTKDAAAEWLRTTAA